MFEEEKLALKSLATEFDRLATKYLPLYHQQLLVDQTAFAASDRQWENFAKANTPSPDGTWQEWHGPYQGRTFDWFGRFHGSPDGVQEFKQLAGSLYLVLRKFIDRVGPWEGLDKEGFSAAEGWSGSLELMHEIANSWPIPLLRSAEMVWGGDEFDDDSDKWYGTPSDETSYPLHPFVAFVENNLFVAAKALIDFLLNPDCAFFVSDMHWSEPPFGNADGEQGPTSEPEGGVEVQTAGAAGLNNWISESAGQRKADDNVFIFDRKSQNVNVRFKFGGADDEVIAHPLPNWDGFLYIAFMLGRPCRWISCLDIPRVKSAGLGRSMISLEEYLATSEDDKHDRRGSFVGGKEWEEMKQSYRERQEAKVMLEEARRNDDEAAETKYEAKFNEIDQYIKRTITKDGRLRELGTPDEQKAAKRVRQSINRAKAKIVTLASESEGADKTGLLALWEHFSAVEVFGTACLYYPTQDPHWRLF